MRVACPLFLSLLLASSGTLAAGCASGGGNNADAGRRDTPIAPGLDAAIDVPGADVPGADVPGADVPPPEDTGGALDTGIDAPMTLVRDSGVDSGPFDGGGIDAGRPDTGPPPECTSATDCTDGNSCNGIERCELGRCVPGVALTCDDGVACTVDTCAASACTYTPTDSRCGAGQRCTATGCMTTGGGCAETPCRLAPPQCGCGAGQSCILNAGARMCGVAGFRSEGEGCTAATDCATGLACVNFSATGTAQMCSRICAGNADCTGGGLCLNEVTGGAARLCTRACNPVNQTGCAPGLLCSIFSDATSGSYVADCTGPAGLGTQDDFCFDESDCAAGYACIDVDGFGPTCNHWCNAVTGTGCGAFYTCYGFTSPVVIGGVEYGVCAF